MLVHLGMKREQRQTQSDLELRRAALYDRLRSKYPDSSDTLDELAWLNEQIEQEKLSHIISGPYAGVKQAWEALAIWLELHKNKPTPLKQISDDLIRSGVRSGFSRKHSNYIASGLFKLGIKPAKTFAIKDMPFLCAEEDILSRNDNPTIWLNPDYEGDGPGRE